MIAKSRLESSPRSDRGKDSPVPRGSEARGEVTLLSASEGRGHVAWSGAGTAVVGGSDVAVLAPRVLTDRVRMVDALGSTGDSKHERLPILDGKDAGRRGLDPRVTSSGGNEGPRVIFVLLMQEDVRADRYDELVVEPSRLMAGDGWEAMNLPSAIRLSAMRDEILAGLARAPVGPVSPSRQVVRPAEPAARLPNLTRREREVLQLILQGHPNKNIAADLRISMRTVENHRAKVMKKTGSKSLPALVRLAIAAGAMPDALPAPAR